MERLGIGKLDSDILQKIVLDRIGHRRAEVKLGGQIGRDCAVVSFGQDLVISSDPITADSADIGRLAVLISCNDIASASAEPIGVTLTVLLPEGMMEPAVRLMVDQAEAAARQINVEIVGGHTEVTHAVRKPVICATAFGRLTRETELKQDAIRQGDILMLTKYAGLEGTGILATDEKDELKNVLSERELTFARNLLDYVSVLKEGQVAAQIGTSAMHDVTEGGVYGAVWELAKASSVGAWVDRSWIPVLGVTQKIAEYCGIDPFRLISSGSMLIAARPEKAAKIRASLHREKISCAQIGLIMNESDGICEIRNGKIRPIEPPGADELYHVVR